jgi:hypothetical protein
MNGIDDSSGWMGSTENISASATASRRSSSSRHHGSSENNERDGKRKQVKQRIIGPMIVYCCCLIVQLSMALCYGTYPMEPSHEGGSTFLKPDTQYQTDSLAHVTPARRHSSSARDHLCLQ